MEIFFIRNPPSPLCKCWNGSATCTRIGAHPKKPIKKAGKRSIASKSLDLFRPNIERFFNFKRLNSPSTKPLLKRDETVSSTASISLSRLLAKFSMEEISHKELFSIKQCSRLKHFDQTYRETRICIYPQYRA